MCRPENLVSIFGTGQATATNKVTEAVVGQKEIMTGHLASNNGLGQDFSLKQRRFLGL